MIVATPKQEANKRIFSCDTEYLLNNNYAYELYCCCHRTERGDSGKVANYCVLAELIQYVQFYLRALISVCKADRHSTSLLSQCEAWGCYLGCCPF